MGGYGGNHCGEEVFYQGEECGRILRYSDSLMMFLLKAHRPAKFRERMEAVLALYAQAYDPSHPMVCFDEKSMQLLTDSRTPYPMKPGQPRRQDYEYRRGGTRNPPIASGHCLSDADMIFPRCCSPFRAKCPS